MWLKKIYNTAHSSRTRACTQDNNLFARIIHSSRTVIYSRLSNTIVVREIYSLSALCHNYRRKPSVADRIRSSRECWFTRFRLGKIENARDRRRQVSGKRRRRSGDLFIAFPPMRYPRLSPGARVPRAGASRKWRRCDRFLCSWVSRSRHRCKVNADVYRHREQLGERRSSCSILINGFRDRVCARVQAVQVHWHRALNESRNKHRWNSGFVQNRESFRTHWHQTRRMRIETLFDWKLSRQIQFAKFHKCKVYAFLINFNYIINYSILVTF